MRIWLKEIREQKKLDHENVALNVGISRSYYTNIENDTKTPSVKVAKALGNFLGFNWTNFFEEKRSCG